MWLGMRTRRGWLTLMTRTGCMCIKRHRSLAGMTRRLMGFRSIRRRSSGRWDGYMFRTDINRVLGSMMSYGRLKGDGCFFF